MNVARVISRLLTVVGGELLEGPAWDDRDGGLLFVDIYGARLHRFDWAARTLETWGVGDTPSAYLPRAMGGFAVCARGGLRLADRPLGDVAVPLEAANANLRTNDAKCDPAGRLWVGTMADDSTEGAGNLYRIDPDLRCTRVLSSLTISNGLGWSPDGTLMYFIDSPTRRIDVLDYDLASGAAGNRRQFVDTSMFPGIPDGMAIDVDGCLWVAFYDGGAVHRYSPSGRPLAEVHVPARLTTSCAFAGPALDQLVITTARTRGADVGGDVYVCRPNVIGMPTVAFRG